MISPEQGCHITLLFVWQWAVCVLYVEYISALIWYVKRKVPAKANAWNLFHLKLAACTIDVWYWLHATLTFDVHCMLYWRNYWLHVLLTYANDCMLTCDIDCMQYWRVLVNACTIDIVILTAYNIDVWYWLHVLLTCDIDCI